MHVHTQEPGWVFPQLRFLVYENTPGTTDRGWETPPGVVKMKKVFQCQLLLGGESEKQRENKVVEENEPPHQETDSWKSVWSNVGYKLKRALSELEAQ